MKLSRKAKIAVGAAALLAGKLRLDGPTAFIISGNNVDPDQFLAVASGAPVNIGDQVVTAQMEKPQMEQG